MRFKKIQNLYKIYIKFLIKWTNIWKIIRLFYQFIKKQIKHTIAPVSDHEIWRLNQIEPSADVKTRTKHARTIANATCVRYHKSVTDKHKNFRSGDTSCFSQHQRLENAHIRPFDSNISVLSRHAINYRIIDYKRRTERVEHTVSFRRFQLNDWYRRPSIDRDLRNEKPFTRQKVTDNAKRDSRVRRARITRAENAPRCNTDWADPSWTEDPGFSSHWSSMAVEVASAGQTK